MKRYIYHIAASLLAVFMLAGCSGATDRPLAGASVDSRPEIAADVTDSLVAHSDESPFAKPAGKMVGSSRVAKNRPATIAAGDVALFIDSGAVSRDVQISILAITEEHSGAIPGHLANLTADRAVYRMLPDGQRFEKDITIAMRYDSTALPYGYTADDIYTFFFNEQSGLWQQVERDSVDPHNQIVYSRTNHFTDYINGVLKVPENSDAMAYTPTSIKDLKAADPLEGITLMAPPEANNQGTANLTYPLTIPAGRRGMQPQLAVSYNSAGGSGILGLGWSMPISEISVETRWGVPLYDYDYETEGYLLDGTALVTSYLDENGNFRLNKPVYHRAYEPRHHADTLRFHPRVEGAFRRIERIGTAPHNYHWLVTDKDGTRHLYGRSSHATLRDHNRNIAKWMLEKSVDTYGNTVSYSYTTYCTPTEDGPAGKQICLTEIVYTGNDITQDAGRYKVRFHYANKRDCTFSFRYGLEETDNYIVDQIDVWYVDSLIREYSFGYRQGDFGKTLLCNIVEGYDDAARWQRYGTAPRPFNRIWSGLNPYDRCGVPPMSTDSMFVPLAHEFEYYEFDTSGLWFDTPVRFYSIGENSSVLSSLSNALCNRFDIPVDSLNIGGSVSVGYNVGGAASVGFDGIKWLKTLSAGGHYSFSKDHSEGIVSIVDINGDGYPDKVYRTIDGLKCRPQLPGENAFGSPVQIRGAKGFQYSSSRTHNWGVEASAIGGLGAGANWSDSRSTTYTYFSDVNGDGLVDIVDDGRVFINRGNFHFSDVTDNDTVFVGGTCGAEAVSFSGQVETRIFDDGDYSVDSIVCIQLWDTLDAYWDTIYDFDPKYALCEKNRDTIAPLPLGDAEVICFPEGNGMNVTARRVRRYRLAPSYDSCYTVTLNKTYRYPRRYEPNIDLVRMWKAPFSGTVLISGVASLTDSLDDFRAMTRATDGVWASLQKASDTLLLDSATISPGRPKPLSASIDVTAGEIIYFRLNAADKRLYDVVSWNPHIQYTHAVHRNGVAPDFDRHDANRNPIYTFDYGDDFMLTGNQTAGVGPDNGAVCTNSYSVLCHIKARGGLTQDMKLSLMCIDTLGYTGNLQSTVFTMGPDSVFSASWNASSIPSDKALFLQLEPVDGGQLNWSDIEAIATITLTRSTDDSLNARAARGLYSFSPVVHRKYYDYLAFPSSVISHLEGTPSIKLNVQSDPAQLSGKIFVTIKDTGGGNYFGQELNLSAGTASFTPSGFSFSSDRHYSLDIYVDNPAVADAINSVKVRLGNQEYDAGMYTKHAPDNQKHHGTLYRGWGQFGYKSDDSTCAYIKPELTEPEALADEYSGCTSHSELPIPQESDINNFSANNLLGDTPEEATVGVFRNPLSASFFEMQPDASNSRWVAFANAVTVSRTLASLDNMDPTDETLETDTLPDMTQSPLPTMRPGTAFKAVNKMSLSTSKGKTALQKSSSNGTSRVLGDYMDLNGDRYPDIVSEAHIQYSKAQGGLGGPVKGYALDRGINSSDFTSMGFAFNGTFASVVRELGNNPKNTRASNTVTGQSQLPPLSTGITKGEDRTGNTFMDINGDGLPDIVYADNRVRYNRGYGFTGFRTAPTLFVRKSQSISCSGGSGFNIGNTSISGGVSINRSENSTEAALMDVNGDGLPDWVFHGDIYINTGEGHARRHPSVGMDGSSTTSFSLNATYTDGVIIPLPFWAMKTTGSVSGGATASFSTTHAEFVDMNNDGYVDYVYRGDSCIWVRYSKVGRSNLLKSVKNFAHARYEIDYELSDATVQSPRRHWNMSKLKIDCGISKNGNNDIYKCFVYEKRIYDPYEREDYGYNVVITDDYIHSDWFPTGKYYRRFCQTFHNDNYYMARLKISERTSDSSGNSFVGTLYQYRDADLTSGRYLGDDTPLWCQGDGWPAVASEETHYNEGTGDIITTKREYTYGQYGNVVSVHDFGDVLSSNDDYSVTIDYNLDHNQHIVSNASNLTIPGYRQRSATYNAKGSLSTLTIDNGGSLSIFRYSYDTYGNLDTVFTPATNSAGDPYWITYSYDSETRSLPIRVENAEGHIGTTSYSHRWQKPTRTTDIGGNTMRYMYDAHGRTNLIKAPKEVVANRPYTIKYDYWYNSRHKLSDYENTNFHPTQLDSGIVFCFWARTRNFDPEHPQNDINTVTFSDGLGRIIQVKKDIEENGIERRSVSGAIFYDYFGRESVHFQTTSEPIDYPDTNINTRTDLSCRTIMNYDYLDRGIRTTYPDGTYDSNAYSIERDDDGIYRFLTAATDQNGNTSLLYTDHRQLNIQLTNALRHTTRFRYDAIGQLMASTDPEGNITEHHYDLGGRRIRRVHPSAGTTQWQYDPAGNMILQTQNSGEQIAYTYDYSRPVHVNYSHRPWNNVWYEYGAAGSGNESGRLVRQQDASGVQEFSYDNMGNVTSNRHTYIQPHTNNTFSLSTSWTYDSWGRVKSITYPDKELVSYHYDHGGNLHHINGRKGLDETEYIKDIHYDRFGQRTYTRYGNGIETHYTYDSLTRRLARMYNIAPNGTLLQDNRYTYDPVGNITAIDDNGLNPRRQVYEYDPADRLRLSEGHMGDLGINYRSEYDYSPAGKIMRKHTHGQRMNNYGTFPVDYTNEYLYPTAGNPFAVEKIESHGFGAYELLWDKNGNMTHSFSPRAGERRMCWTEDNRMQGYTEYSDETGDISAWYNYDGGGERNFKITSPKLRLRQNAAGLRYAAIMKYPTLYASALVTFNRGGYTKHYFEGTNRICSKIGGGFSDVEWNRTIERVPEMQDDYSRLSERQSESVHQTFEQCLGIGVAMEGVADLYDVIKKEHERDEKEPAFYYHSDHLGSAAYLTNDDGKVTQTLNYLPYGEDWVDVRYDLDPRLGQYTFNGKEKDHESGFHYYGARYYWSELLTSWLSVDPMMDKYPSLSPYNYCLWNPIKLTDPDGEFPRLPYFVRVATSKHVYSAIAYKVKHGGSLDVWEHPSGCIFASVQSKDASIDESGAAVIEAKMFRPEGYSDHAEIKATTDIFVNAESWMDEPATGLIDFGAKTVASIGYSTINDLAITLTGHSLGGTEATPNERAEACVGYVSGKLGRGLKKGMGLIKTEGATGLGKYNDFVHKMGNYQGKTKKEMGRLYQQNKNLNNAVSTYDNSRRIIDGVSTLEKEK